MSHKSGVTLIFSNHLRQGELITLKRSQQVTVTVTVLSSANLKDGNSARPHNNPMK